MADGGWALPCRPRNLRSIWDGRVIVELTLPAEVSISVRRLTGRREVARLQTSLGAGRSQLALPRRLSAGEYRLELTARSPDGAVAIDALGVFGRRRLEIDAARRAISGRPKVEGNLGRANCRRRSGLRARCRVREYGLGGVPESLCVIDVHLRPDGRLEAREPRSECVDTAGDPYIVDPH